MERVATLPSPPIAFASQRKEVLSRSRERKDPRGSVAWRVSGLLELEQCGFTLEDFAKVVGRSFEHYSELSVGEQLDILSSLGGKRWYESFSVYCEGYARAKILLHSAVTTTEETETRENASQDT
jgi:hypothetical protein